MEWYGRWMEEKQLHNFQGLLYAGAVMSKGGSHACQPTDVFVNDKGPLLVPCFFLPSLSLGTCHGAGIRIEAKLGPYQKPVSGFFLGVRPGQ